jgi:GTPase SAR1 family protein
MSDINAKNVGAAGNIENLIQHNHFYVEKPQPLSTPYTESDVQKFFDALKKIYKEKYQQKVGKFFEIIVKARKDWNSQNLLANGETADINEAIKVIKEEFLEKGRLLLVGNPSVGKTGLLLKFSINLMEKIQSPENESFPVIFNLASWSNKYERFGDWLIDMLVSGMGLTKDFAAELLDKKRIIFLFDGLDDITRTEHYEIQETYRDYYDDEDEISTRTVFHLRYPEQIRANCLNAINLFIESHHQTIICIRREDIETMQAQTVQDIPIFTGIEVLNLTKDEVLSALEQAKQDPKSRIAAIHTLKNIEKNNVLLDILDTPFFLTTALEVFDQQNQKEVDLPNEAKKLESYLLSKFIDKKLYRNTKTNLESAKTIKWLAYLAKIMIPI